jgi:lysophospholipase L1-like esterase
MKRFLRRALLVVLAPLCVIGALELLVVLWGFEYPPEISPILLPLPEGKVDGKLLHRRDVHELWCPIPGATVPWGRDAIDAAGFRGPELPPAKEPGVVRIAALGDSSTFGHSVEWDQTWCALLPGLLAEQGVRAESINAGVIGSTVRQGLERWRRRVQPLHPDVVVAAYGAVNEHVPAIVLPDARLIEKGLFEQSPWVVEVQRLRRDLRLLHFFAYCADSLRGGREQLRAAAHQRELWKSHHADEAGRIDWPGDRRVSVADFGADLRELARLVEADGGRLVLLAMPRRPSVYRTAPVVEKYTEETFTAGRAAGVPVVDGKAAFAQAIADGATYPDLFADNYHPTPFGHEKLARVLVPEVLRAAGRAPAPGSSPDAAPAAAHGER